MVAGGKVDRNCSIDSILNSSSDSFNIPSPPLSPKFASAAPRQSIAKRLDLNAAAVPAGIPAGIRTVDMQTASARKLSDDIYEFLTQYRMLDGLKRKLEYPGPSHTHPESTATAMSLRHVRASPRLALPASPSSSSQQQQQQQRIPLYYNTRYHYARLPSPVVHKKAHVVHKVAKTSHAPSPTKKRKSVRSPSSSQFQQHHNPNPNIVSVKAIQHVPQYVPGVSWEKLPDYSPPLSTLPESNRNCLKIEWKGNPMDLSVDPLRSKLHPAEIVLASILRLPCDLYLDSKRRLFLEKVYKQKKGMPFRKTDAQKACKIDVNKASRLYSAFEKVGWLDNRHFEKYMKDINL